MRHTTKRPLTWKDWAVLATAGAAVISAVVPLIIFLLSKDGPSAAEAPPPAVTSTAAPTASSAVVTVASFDELTDLVAAAAATELPAGETVYQDFDTIGTTSSSISVPAAWSDRDEAVWAARNGDLLGETVAASENLLAMGNGEAVPGLQLVTSGAFDGDNDLLDGKAVTRTTCEGGEPKDFFAEGYEGEFRIWSECGPEGSQNGINLDIVVQDLQYRGTIAIFARLTDTSDVTALRASLDSLATVQRELSTDQLTQAVDSGESSILGVVASDRGLSLPFDVPAMPGQNRKLAPPDDEPSTSPSEEPSEAPSEGPSEEPSDEPSDGPVLPGPTTHKDPDDPIAP